MSWQLACACAGLVLLIGRQAEATEIFWASDPVRPGEDVLLIGEDFGEAPAVRVSRLQDEDGEGGGLGEVVIGAAQLALSGRQQIAFKLPPQLGAGAYSVEVRGQGAPARVLINVPAAYWIQGSEGARPTPGGQVRLFGRNIQSAGHTARLRLKLSENDPPLVLDAKQGDLWSATFALPASLPPGSYAVEASNGTGALAGWMQAGRLEVSPPEEWPSQIFDVKGFGAKGDGRADDTTAVQAALNAAGNAGGGIVVLPRGRYKLSQGLKLPKYVTLAGEHRDLSALTFVDLKDPPPALVSGAGQFAVRDLAIFASNHKLIIADGAAERPSTATGSVKIERVLIRASTYRGHPKGTEVGEKYQKEYDRSQSDAILIGGENLRIVDSDVYGSGRPVVLVHPRGAYVARNKFYIGRTGWYSIAGGDGVIFESNEIVGADLMASGGGINTHYASAASRNIYFAGNTLKLMHGVDREAMTTDGSGGFYFGKLSAIAPRRYKIFDGINEQYNKNMPNWRGAGVFILGGRGRGQVVKVEAIEGDTVVTDREFAVMPDDTSVISITQVQENYLIVRNHFEDTGVAVQFYGTSVNHVVSGNTTQRASGMWAMGRWYNHYQPSWFCQFLDNEISEGNVYRGGPNSIMFAEEAQLSFEVASRPPNRAPLLIGGVARRNRLLGNAHINVSGGADASAPGIVGVIIENNTILNSNFGIRVDAGAEGVVQNGNTY